MLPRLKLIQVGDIHLATAAKRGRTVDDKDFRFPQQLRASISANPLKASFKKLFEILDTGGVSAVLFMGDLTDHGNIENYKNCARYIAEALEIGINRNFSDVPIGIVPGNHDIDRLIALEPGMTRKFQPLNAALHSNGLPELPVERPISFKIGDTSSEANVYLLNSCWGCGEKEFIPEKFRDAIADAITVSLSGAKSTDALAEYYDRQLDTPAFSEVVPLCGTEWRLG
jgi:hypothetical protein